MLTTTDVAAFVPLAAPGDILVFDSLSSLSGLVQWADKAPVNHCALLIEHDTLVMANEPKRSDPDRTAVRRHSLCDTLELARVRAATILRPSLSEEQSVALLTIIGDYLERGCDFAILDLAWLLSPALIRAYGESDDGAAHQQFAMRMLVDALEAIAQKQLDLIPDTAEKLTCSEFVYRALIEAGIGLEIVDPLDGALREHGIKPETVTPGDFWRSPSLEAIAYLVKEPPRPGGDDAPG